MNRRGPIHPFDTELRELEQELARLTLHIATLRNRTDTAAERELAIGSRISFKIDWRNLTGEIIGVTAQRVRIQEDASGHIFLRAPHNVTLIVPQQQPHHHQLRMPPRLQTLVQLLDHNFVKMPSEMPLKMVMQVPVHTKQNTRIKTKKKY